MPVVGFPKLIPCLQSASERQASLALAAVAPVDLWFNLPGSAAGAM